MGTTVKLTVTGRQRDEFGTETVTETKADAEYYEKNGTLYIFYEETPEGTNAIIKNTIKFKNNCLELTKKGPLNTRMVFDPKQDYKVNYNTPFGALQMDIHTTGLTCGWLQELPQITAEYTLSNEDTLISHCLVSINLRI